MLYGEARAYQEHAQKLLDEEHDFVIELMKILVQAIVTGKVSRR